MTFHITTDADVMRHTAHRVAVATGLSVVMTFAILTLHLGTDYSALVRTGDVVIMSLTGCTMITALLSGMLGYRSGKLMQQLTLTRSEMLRISRTDQLTGLLNRRGFEDAAVPALHSACHAGLPAVVLMCDIDRFKSINDRFGHEFGDKALAAVADVLRQFSRTHGALVGRHGGEEFAALMIGISRDTAQEIAEDIRRACAGRDIVSGKIAERLTISIGLTVTHGETDLAKILRVADQALYMAKRQGRDRVIRADEATLAAA